MFKQAAEAVKVGSISVYDIQEANPRLPQDLFRHERITILDEHGNYVDKVIKPEPLINPITLLRMLTWKNWLFFIVGLAAWTVDGYDCKSAFIVGQYLYSPRM